MQILFSLVSFSLDSKCFEIDTYYLFIRNIKLMESFTLKNSHLRDGEMAQGEGHVQMAVGLS